MKRYSEITFGEINKSAIGGFVKIIWNGRLIYEDRDEGLYIEGKKVKFIQTELENFINKYKNKQVYNFYCRVVEFHHTELYIEGDK